MRSHDAVEHPAFWGKSADGDCAGAVSGHLRTQGAQETARSLISAPVSVGDGGAPWRRRRPS
jgi:hypothetical protein